MEQRWPTDWDAQRAGTGCPLCATPDSDSDEFGIRILDSQWSDAYLGRYPIRSGYAFVVWKGRHVGEPTELSADEAGQHPGSSARRVTRRAVTRAQCPTAGGRCRRD